MEKNGATGGPHKSKQGHTLTRSLAVVVGDDEVVGGGGNGKDDAHADLLPFIHETINKNTKDRNLLLRTEAELVQFINSGSHSLPLPGPYSSYQRLLIHRVAAYFKLDHNLDASGSGILISRSAQAPLPEAERRKFRDLITPNTPPGTSAPDLRRPRKVNNQSTEEGWRTGQRILKVASFDGPRGPPPQIHLAKAYSFGGYGRAQHHTPHSRALSTQTSLSPASSGYKSTSFPSMELRTPSPAGPYFPEEPPAPPAAHSHELSSPHGQAPQAQNSSQELVLWAVSDLKSVPPGALLIDPNTLGPVRYESNGAGGGGVVLPQQGQILQPQYYPVGGGAYPAAPFHPPTYLPLPPNYYEPNGVAEVGNWFAGMSLSPAQYYGSNPQAHGAPTQPTMYFPSPPQYNYYAPRHGGPMVPPPPRYYYGAGAPTYVNPGILFQSQPHQHHHHQPPDHSQMVSGGAWYGVSGSEPGGAYGVRAPSVRPLQHIPHSAPSSHPKHKYRN